MELYHPGAIQYQRQWTKDQYSKYGKFSTLDPVMLETSGFHYVMYFDELILTM